MSALGQKRTWQRILLMSALPPKADIAERNRAVRIGARIVSLVGSGEISPRVLGVKSSIIFGGADNDRFGKTPDFVKSVPVWKAIAANLARLPEVLMAQPHWR